MDAHARALAGAVPIALAVLAAASLTGGCASRTGKATEGALEALRAPPPEGGQRVGVRVGGDTAEGILGKLSSPEGIESISRIVDAAVARSLATALRHPPVAGRRGWGGGGGASAGSLVGRVGADTGAGFADAFAVRLEDALGPDGQGPLAASLGAAASQISGSAARGVRDELSGSLFSGCALDDRQCLEAEVRSLGRAASTGFVEGLVATAALPALVLTFVLGAAVALLARAAYGRERRPRDPGHREAHP